MGRPQPLITPKSSGSSINYPADINDENYSMSFRFVRYKRDKGSTTARYPLVGSVITMPLPNELNESYNINQGGKTLGAFRDLESQGKVGLQAISSAIDTVKSEIAKARAGLAKGEKLSLDSIVKTALNVSELGKYALVLTPDLFQDSAALDATSRYFGMIKNPHTSLIFDGVNLRTHNFSWTLSPRSEAESIALHTIINEFRQHAHPTFTPTLGTMALDYPDYVYVNWNGAESPYLYPVKRSGITNISVNNAAGGGPAFYRGGAPVAINFAIQLTETEILTRADFGDTVTNDGSYASETTPGVSINAGTTNITESTNRTTVEPTRATTAVG